MAKTFDNLYPQLTDFANLYDAWRKAAKGKRGAIKFWRFPSAWAIKLPLK